VSNKLSQRSTDIHNAIDERAVYALLKSVVYRNMGDLKTAKTILEDDVLSIDKTLLKGGLKEDWPGELCLRVPEISISSYLA